MKLSGSFNNRWYVLLIYNLDPSNSVGIDSISGQPLKKSISLWMHQWCTFCLSNGYFQQVSAIYVGTALSSTISSTHNKAATILIKTFKMLCLLVLYIICSECSKWFTQPHMWSPNDVLSFCFLANLIFNTFVADLAQSPVIGKTFRVSLSQKYMSNKSVEIEKLFVFKNHK